MRSKILFFGTPDSAVPSLSALLKHPDFDVVGVVTQPDRPSGRGQKLTPTPVKAFASQQGLTIAQPLSLRGIKGNDQNEFTGGSAGANGALLELLNSSQFDFFVVVAFGQIIPPSLIAAPTMRILNVHFSLLPRWRGAAPVQRSILAGDRQTGVSIMQIDAGLDTGPVYATATIEIANQTSGELLNHLAELGATLLTEVMPQIRDRQLMPQPQKEIGVTYAERWTNEDSMVRWDEPAEQIERRIRASTPAPGARTFLGVQQIKLFNPSINLELKSDQRHQAEPGTLISVGPDAISIATGERGAIEIGEIQLPGRKRLPVREVIRGFQLRAGDRLTNVPISG